MLPPMNVIPLRRAVPRAPAPDESVLRELDLRAPRYTSYPTADRFVEAFGPAAHASWLRRRGLGASVPLSLYVHVPFCATLCYYCACNKIITKDRSKAPTYLRYVERELALQLEHLAGDRRVSQMHWGGGSPTFLDAEQMAHLMRMLRSAFEFMPGGDYSIEVDPRSLPADQVSALAELGFNRMSLGVQDFDPEVQRAVHRVQPIETTLAVLEAARASHFESVNFDLIYGLPRQSLESFARTVQIVIDARPDRIALYNYAHLPQRFKAQRRIHELDLPSAQEKLAIFSLAIERLEAAGYAYIGMDHFALPDDELAVAQRSGRLHRNFQGYTTQPDCDLLALGISSISKIGPTYSQNLRTVDEYYDALDNRTLPIMRGIELTRDDLVRRTVIMGLMCQGHLPFEPIETGYLIDFRQYFAPEFAELERLADHGLVRLEADAIAVTERGRHFLRAICAPFDRHLRNERDRVSYSKIL